MKKLIIALLVISVYGCASLPRQTFNAALNSHIKTIAIIAPPKTLDEIPVVIHAHPAGNQGLIGALIAEADMASKTTSYNNALRPIKADLAELSLKKLTETLQQTGYVTNVIAIRGAEDREFLETYPTTNADAILDYTIHPRQVAAGANTNYIPTLGCNVRLIDAKNKAILYEEHIISGLVLSSFEDKLVTFPSNLGYSDIDQLIAHTKESQDGLIDGIDKATNRIAGDLKKQSTGIH